MVTFLAVELETKGSLRLMELNGRVLGRSEVESVGFYEPQEQQKAFYVL